MAGKRMARSPLRYPGGKRRLAPYIGQVVREGGDRPALFVEPFAGGAAVSIAMLDRDLVDQIALSDADPMVASFWSVVFSRKRSDARELADRVATAVVDLDRWREMRRWEPSDRMDLAYQCLFLNRTTFSGILHGQAGPIGGWTQQKNLVDCRFPREELARRIMALSDMRDRVRFVRNQDWRKTVSDVGRIEIAKSVPERLFWYIDPPFFHKADILYRHVFDLNDHRRLAQAVPHLPGHWLVSYDAAEEIRSLYDGHAPHVVEMAYSAARRQNALDAKELIISDRRLPAPDAPRGNVKPLLLAIDGPAAQVRGDPDEMAAPSRVAA